MNFISEGVIYIDLTIDKLCYSESIFDFPWEYPTIALRADGSIWELWE